MSFDERKGFDKPPGRLRRHWRPHRRTGGCEACSEVLFVEVELEVLALSFDDFGQGGGAAVEHVDLPFVLLGHLLE